MALQKPITQTLDNGFIVSSAAGYVKILEYSGIKSDVVFRSAIYKDRNSCVEGKAFLSIQTHTFNYNLESNDNVLTQAYNYLKTLPEFADATDC